MAGYTAHINLSSTNQGLLGPIATLVAVPYDYYWNGTYTVTHDASGSTVASGQFSISANAHAFLPVVGVMFSDQQTFTIK